MARVIVLGGGFGGLAAASELRRILPRSDEIVLVSASGQFFMGFAKLWDLAGTRPLAQGSRPLDSLAARGVGWVQDEVTAIEPAAMSVSTAGGGRIEGDAMIVALGSVPVAAQAARVAVAGGYDLYDAGALDAMRVAIDNVAAGRVVVAILGAPFKCPPAPYEAAMVVDGRLRARRARPAVRIDVVTSQPMTLPAAGPDASRFVADQLAACEIGLLDRRVVERIDPGTLRFAGGDSLDFALLLAVLPETAPPVLAASGLVGPSGFVEPDRATLRTSTPGVYAVGDCTSIPTATAQLPKAGVFAAAQARVAARNVAADLHGGDGAAFDGHGLCYLELPGNRVATVEGNFFAEPRPAVVLTEPSEESFRAKQAYERDRLAEWLG